jgi:hypothetical protein
MAYSRESVALPKLIPPAVRHVTLEYRGFRDLEDRREFFLCARLGTESCDYTVWIANTAFAAKHALIQDGPDICFQKLRRELAGAEPTGVQTLTAGQSFQVTESELLEYRTAHLPPQRRGGFTAKSGQTPSSQTPEKRG